MRTATALLAGLLLAAAASASRAERDPAEPPAATADPGLLDGTGAARRGAPGLTAEEQAGLIDKTYWAVVAGAPPQVEGRIEAPLLKTTRKDGGWRMLVDPKGQAAATRYRVMGSGDGLTWLELKPETGRTHQVRVHCAELGCPILGEPMYGALAPQHRKAPLHLHARAVVIPLSKNKPPIAVSAEPPEHMRSALTACGWNQQ